MRLTNRQSLIACCAALVVALAPAATASAEPPAPTPAAVGQLSFSIPAIGGIEAGPASVPGGSFAPVEVLADPAPRTLQYPPPPGATQFRVAHPAAYHYQYAYRYVLVSWRNLETGKTGDVRLRHWQLPDHEVSGYPASLPTIAVAPTGSGPVVATVTVLREQWQAPPQAINVIPGVDALIVP